MISTSTRVQLVRSVLVSFLPSSSWLAVSLSNKKTCKHLFCFRFRISSLNYRVLFLWYFLRSRSNPELRFTARIAELLTFPYDNLKNGDGVPSRQIQACILGRSIRWQNQHHHSLHVWQIRYHLSGHCWSSLVDFFFFFQFWFHLIQYSVQLLYDEMHDFQFSVKWKWFQMSVLIIMPLIF